MGRRPAWLGVFLLWALPSTALLACSSGESSYAAPTTTPTASQGGGGGATTSTTTSGIAGSGGTGAAGGAGGAAECPPVAACDTAPPTAGPAEDWLNFGSTLVVLQGAARHRGRDLFLTPSDPQWVLGKFAYGLADDDLKGERVDIYLDRDCAGSWAKLGTAITTDDEAHATVEGVEDTGGRVFFQIPEAERLGVGRHRIHMVVLGDLSRADQIIEVIDPSTPVFVSDIDGTLTVSDTETWTSLLTGNQPENWPSSPEALRILAAKGLRPFYLTARPEWLDNRSREFLVAYGYPPGIMHTTLDGLGATGSSAATYKTNELAWAVSKGASFEWAFGNADTDAQAYDNADIQPVDHRVYIGLENPAGGGRLITSYAELLDELSALPSSCAP